MLVNGDANELSVPSVNIVPLKENITTGQLMNSNLETVSPDTNLMEAWQVMVNLGVRHLPVTDNKGVITGIISDRDLARLGTQISAFPVSQVMCKNIITATIDTQLTDVAALMLDKKIGSVPVIDENNKAIGIVTRSDIMKMFFQLN